MTRYGRLVRLTLITLAFGFLAFAIVATWDTFVEALTFDPIRFVAAVAVSLAAYILLAWSWAAIHPTAGSRRSLARRFLLAQPAKYIPGGVAMPMGQVLLARPLDTSGASAVGRLVVHSGIMVIASLTVSSVSVLSGPRHWLGGVGLGLAIVGAAILFTADLDRVLRSAGRLLRRLVRRSGDPTEIGLAIDRATLAKSLALAVPAMAGLAAGFAIVADPELGPRAPLVAAFALAWVVGFVLVPLPAGAGAREATLIYALGGSVAAGAVIATALVHRAALLAAEFVLASYSGTKERSTL